MITSDNILPEMNHVLHLASRHDYFSSLLENLLEVELFLRSPKGLHLTDAGRALLDSARVFDSIEAATIRRND